MMFLNLFLENGNSSCMRECKVFLNRLSNKQIREALAVRGCKIILNRLSNEQIEEALGGEVNLLVKKSVDPIHKTMVSPLGLPWRPRSAKYTRNTSMSYEGFLQEVVEKSK